MGGTHGSAIPYIVMNDIAKFEVPFDKDVFDNISPAIKVVVDKIQANEQENEKLAAIRDALLPKLMSGEIDVSNVDISALTSTDKLSFRCRSPPKKYLIDFPKYLFLIRQIVEFSFGNLWCFHLAICGVCGRKISGDQASDQPEVTSDQPEFFTIAQKPYGIRVSAKG